MAGSRFLIEFGLGSDGCKVRLLLLFRDDLRTAPTSNFPTFLALRVPRASTIPS
jgi:hypothetical protein